MKSRASFVVFFQCLFKPLGHASDVVIFSFRLFNALQLKNMTPIVDIQMLKLQQMVRNPLSMTFFITPFLETLNSNSIAFVWHHVQLLEDKRVTLTVHDSARTWLAQTGYEPKYGARPLKRVIQRSVLTPLAEKVLSGAIHDGAAVEVWFDFFVQRIVKD
jgi:hypothetical protein